MYQTVQGISIDLSNLQNVGKILLPLLPLLSPLLPLLLPPPLLISPPPSLRYQTQHYPQHYTVYQGKHAVGAGHPCQGHAGGGQGGRQEHRGKVAEGGSCVDHGLVLHAGPLTGQYPGHRAHAQAIAIHGEEKEENKKDILFLLRNEVSEEEETDEDRTSSHYGGGEEEGISSSKLVDEEQREDCAEHSKKDNANRDDLWLADAHGGYQVNSKESHEKATIKRGKNNYYCWNDIVGVLFK